MSRRVVTANQLAREAHLGLYKLALQAAAIIAAAFVLPVVACYLPNGFPFRDAAIAGSSELEYAVPSLLYTSCLISLCGVARNSGDFQWRAWMLAAFVTGVWPFICLVATMFMTSNALVLDLSPATQRVLHLAAILPAVQILCWSIAAVIGRVM